jgi:hypothetical protein
MIVSKDHTTNKKVDILESVKKKEISYLDEGTKRVKYKYYI